MRRPGILAALGAAFLFGASTPASKALLADVSPWMLAGLLYLGSGLGLGIYRLATRQAASVQLTRSERLWFAGAVTAGGILAPVLLMVGLTNLGASTASLLLNAESVLTALLAWFVFRESVDLRIALGMVAIVAGAIVLTWNSATTSSISAVGPSLAVIGACLAWAIDNNLTRKVSLADPTWIACVKGLTAGATNLLLAFIFVPGRQLPSAFIAASALGVGFVACGISLSLFVVSLRHLGTARTGAYFSMAPFMGAGLSIVFLGENFTWQLGAAGVLMGAGVWLHLTEHHSHSHTHDVLEHEHEHVHDEHHLHPHEHEDGQSADGKHTHHHRHDPVTHEHAHFPDAHHRHRH